MNTRPPHHAASDAETGSREVLIVGGRATDPLGRSLRQVFPVDRTCEEPFASLLRRLG